MITKNEIINSIKCCTPSYNKNCENCYYNQYKKLYITNDTCESRLMKDVLCLLTEDKIDEYA